MKNKLQFRFMVCFVWIALCGLGCSNQASIPETISLYAAASTIDSVSEIVTRFEQANDVNVKTNFAGSSTLALQIINGAEADLFFSADLDWIDEIKDLNPNLQFRKVLENQLVFVGSTRLKSKDWYPSRIEEIVDKRVKRIAIGDPTSVPAGRYSKRALQKLNLWEKASGKFAYSTDVRQALAQIESGAADYGIIYQTDARASENVFVLNAIPRDQSGPIEYYLALTTFGQANPNANQLYEYFFATQADRIFGQFGFVPVDKQQK